MAIQPITKAGKVGITQVGHTTSGQFGTSPSINVRGRSAMPTDLSHGK